MQRLVETLRAAMEKHWLDVQIRFLGYAKSKMEAPMLPQAREAMLQQTLEIGKDSGSWRLPVSRWQPMELAAVWGQDSLRGVARHAQRWPGGHWKAEGTPVATHPAWCRA